jgi:hypothetical protein
MLGATTVLLLPSPSAIVVSDKRYWSLDRTMVAHAMTKAAFVPELRCDDVGEIAVAYWKERVTRGTMTLTSADTLVPVVFRVYQKWVGPTNYVAVEYHGGWRGA